MKKYFVILFLSQLCNLSFAQNNSGQGLTYQPFVHNATCLPVGTTISYCGNITEKLMDEGWLICDGSTVNRRFYPFLFEAIGEMWGDGGDGKYNSHTGLGGNFNLPDFRGEFLRGVDGSAGNDPNAEDRIAKYPGGNIKDSVGSYQQDEFKSHTHTFGTSVHLSGGGGTGTWTQTGSTETGARGGTETRPKNAYVYFLIKVK